MIVIDSSSLILLAKIGVLDKVIMNSKEKLAVTDKVCQESISRNELFDAQIIKSKLEEKLIEKVKVKNIMLYRRIRKDFNIGEGEAESIALCLETKTDLITDDRKAINACRALKIRFTTTGKLLVKLYEKGRITKVETDGYIKKLERFGRYSKAALQEIMKDVTK